jgi:hypothetical protein
VPKAVAYANKALEWCRELTKAFSKASLLFKKLDDVLGKAQAVLTKRGDDFATVLRESAEARHVGDFSWGGMAEDALGEAKKVVVDGVTGLPKDIGPALGEEFLKEGSKVVDNGGWESWRELKAKQDEEDEKKRKEVEGRA